MTQATISKTRRSLVSFIILLVAFLVVADTFVITQQSHSLRTEMDLHTGHEFDLFSKLVADSLTKGEYAAVEQAALAWGNERDNILALKITSANGFDIANFHRDMQTTESKYYETKLDFGVRNTATISMLKDLTTINTAINKLAFQLILVSIMLVALLGILLQRLAFRPLRQEIIEHKQTEEKLEQHAAELRESNKELESYSYSIAHDLRSPLRSITSFSQILLEDAHDKLSNEEKDHLARIINASVRMAALIDDILELGRVTRTKVEHTDIDLTALAKTVVEQFYNKDDNRVIDWQIQEGINLRGDKKLLRLLFENLLGNALKFTGKKDHPRIEFGRINSTPNGEKPPVYYVKDNGVGFDMQYAEKLFEPFHRLCSREEFEGTGIGLATVERIISRHGGKVWAEAKPNAGATFYFTLPQS
jgi:signal transduction histidine kinase